MGEIEEMANENDSSDDEGLDSDQSEEELENEEGSNESSEEDEELKSESSSDSGAMVPDYSGLSSDSEEETAVEESNNDGQGPSHVKKELNKLNVISKKSKKKGTVVENNEKTEEGCKVSSEAGVNKTDDEFKEGDTSDEEVSVTYM